MPHPRRRLPGLWKTWIPGALTTLLLCIWMTAAAEEAPPDPADDFKLRQVRTEHMRLIYMNRAQDYLIPHLTRCFENSLNYHKSLFEYTPDEYVTLIFQDMDDHGYAGTTTMPYNYLTLGIEPFEHVYETSPTNERINWVMSHELLHVVAADQASGTDRFFRKVFTGKVAPNSDDPVSIFYSYLTNPRRYAPRWYHEGLAVFFETWMAGGIGRAQNGYDEMVFRAMVRDDSYFYDLVGIESEGTAADFQMGQLSYLYGTRFVSYMGWRDGPDRIVEWAKRQPGTKRSFSLQFKKVFGQGIHDAWQEWIDWERGWQHANLDSIRQYPVTGTRDVTDRSLGSVSRSFFDQTRRELITAVRYPGEFAHIAAIDVDTGKSRKIVDIATPALYFVSSLAYDDSTGTIFYTTNNARGWRDLNMVNVDTGESKRLVKWARTGDLAFNHADRSLWGIMHHNGLVQIVRIPPPYDAVYVVMPLDYRQDFYDMDVSPDGRFLTGTLVDVGGRSKLIRVNIDGLLLGGGEIEELHQFGDHSPLNFVYSPDGRHLYGTSYLTGTSNIFRYDFETKVMDAVSNAETGYFRPIPAGPDSVIAYEYTGDGMKPVIMADATLEDIAPLSWLGVAIGQKHPEVDDWVLGSPLSVDPDSVIVYQGDYNAFRSMRMNSIYPVIEGYKHWTAVGLRADFSDPTGIHSAHLAASYTGQKNVPSDEKFHARFNYRTYPWRVWGSWNLADFYDLFGPTKVSRKGFQAGLGYEGYILDDKPKTLKYGLTGAYYWGLEVLPEFQNVPTSYDEFASFGGNLSYSTAMGTIGGIEAEKGFMTRLVVNGTVVRGDFFSRTSLAATWGFLTPIDHSSLWFRLAGGSGTGPIDEPFANFFFGGFGNNWVDHGPINRYRGLTSFPGVEINEVGGRTFGKGSVEWTLPPLRFKKLGITNFYATWARLAFFGQGVVTNPDNDEWRREVVNVGAQLNMKLILFFSLESTLSAGYARAFEDGYDPSDELMVSLKILR